MPDPLDQLRRVTLTGCADESLQLAREFLAAGEPDRAIEQTQAALDALKTAKEMGGDFGASLSADDDAILKLAEGLL